MKRLIATLAMLSCAAVATAALKPGDKAPDFSTQASLAGKAFDFSLASALKKGPVVLYFYPAAFTPGCTVEAHEFAEATAEFQALGATVIGVSHDDIDKLNQILGHRMPQQICRRRRPGSAHHEILRCGAGQESAVRGSDLVRDSTGRQDHLPAIPISSRICTSPTRWQPSNSGRLRTRTDPVRRACLKRVFLAGGGRADGCRARRFLHCLATDRPAR